MKMGIIAHMGGVPMSKPVFYVQCVIMWINDGYCVYDVVSNAGVSRFVPALGSKLPEIVLDYLATHDGYSVPFPSGRIFYPNPLGVV